MRVASPVQATSPLTSFSGFRGFGLAGACVSALEVGGDFYEAIPLSESSLLLVIADVMGKGLGASLFADSLRTLVRALAGPGTTPAHLLSEINHLMFEDLSRADMFITLQVVTADLQHRRLSISNAGHCPLLVCDGAGPSRAIAPDGLPLGIRRDAAFCQESIDFPCFGAVLLYTDGLTEARNSSGRFFGQENLEAWFSNAMDQGHSAAELGANLLNRLWAFQEGDKANDDQTFLILTEETPRFGDFWTNRGTAGWPADGPEDAVRHSSAVELTPLRLY